MRQLGPRVSTVDGSTDQVSVSTDADTMKNRINRPGVAWVCQQSAAPRDRAVFRFVHELPGAASVRRTPNPVVPEQTAKGPTRARVEEIGITGGDCNR